MPIPLALLAACAPTAPADTGRADPLAALAAALDPTPVDVSLRVSRTVMSMGLEEAPGSAELDMVAREVGAALDAVGPVLELVTGAQPDGEGWSGTIQEEPAHLTLDAEGTWVVTLGGTEIAAGTLEATTHAWAAFGPIDEQGTMGEVFAETRDLAAASARWSFSSGAALDVSGAEPQTATESVDGSRVLAWELDADGYGTLETWCWEDGQLTTRATFTGNYHGESCNVPSACCADCDTCVEF